MLATIPDWRSGIAGTTTGHIDPSPELIHPSKSPADYTEPVRDTEPFSEPVNFRVLFPYVIVRVLVEIFFQSLVLFGHLQSVQYIHPIKAHGLSNHQSFLNRGSDQQPNREAQRDGKGEGEGSERLEVIQDSPRGRPENPIQFREAPHGIRGPDSRRGCGNRGRF